MNPTRIVLVIVAAFLIGFLCLPLPLLAAGERLELRDLFEIEEVSDPQISPDGNWIVYVRAGADIMTDRRFSNLWIVRFDGSSHRPLTTGQHRRTSPRFSPGGDRLAYLSDEDDTSQIHLRYMDYGQTAQLTHLQHDPSGLAWSPDGQWLSFLSLVPEAPPKLGKQPEAPPGAEWAEPAKLIDRLIYRFDQVGYLPRGNFHQFVVPAEGGTPRQITTGPYNYGGPGPRAGSSSAAWAPDSRAIVVSANRRLEWELEPLDSDLWEFSVADGAARRLTDRKGPDAEPVFSPDGTKIAYTGYDDRYQGYQNVLLYVMDRAGGAGRPLTAALDRSVSSPAWSADGRRLFFLYDTEGQTHLAAVTLDGAITELATGIGSGISAYSGGAYTVARDGRFAFTRSDPRTPTDVGVGGPAEKTTRKLTAVNDDLLGHKALGELEELRYTSAHDGRKIEGWIMKPPGFDPQRKYPLVLEIHGGPFAAYGPKFDLEKQLIAAGDYVVLYTNPRGSTSYGEEFGNLIHHAYPGDDFHDLMSGVDAVIALGYVDPEQLYVTGGSGGGVLTSWVIGRSDRFRAAVTVYPVINWYSWALTADISSFGVRYWFPGPPWENAEHYESRSLLSVVGNVKTPTMVLTGEEDYRTPISESEQYYAALKLRGVEAVFVRVPGEPHGIRRRPSHHAQKIAYILGWFDRYRNEAAEAQTPSP